MNILPVLPYKTLWMDICVASLIYCLVVKFSKDCASHSCMDHLQPALCVQLHGGYREMQAVIQNVLLTTLSLLSTQSCLFGR